MAQQLFSSLYLNNLGIDNLYGIVKTTVEISIPVRDSIGDIAAIALDKLTAVNLEMEKRMKKTLGSALTPELKEKNASRNGFFSEAKRFVVTAEKSSSATLKAAGTTLKTFLTPYWNSDTQPLNTITSIYEEIIDRYESDEALKAAATTIGIAALFTEFESVNAAYDAAYKERNAEISSKTGNSASEIKGEVVQAYDQYCTIIEQSVNLLPNEKLLALFAEMDGLRRKYAVIKPKTR